MEIRNYHALKHSRRQARKSNDPAKIQSSDDSLTNDANVASLLDSDLTLKSFWTFFSVVLFSFPLLFVFDAFITGEWMGCISVAIILTVGLMIYQHQFKDENHVEDEKGDSDISFERDNTTDDEDGGTTLRSTMTPHDKNPEYVQQHRDGHGKIERESVESGQAPAYFRKVLAREFCKITADTLLSDVTGALFEGYINLGPLATGDGGRIDVSLGLGKSPSDAGHLLGLGVSERRGSHDLGDGQEDIRFKLFIEATLREAPADHGELLRHEAGLTANDLMAEDLEELVNVVAVIDAGNDRAGEGP